MDCPCTRDCPDRVSGCHCKCPKYKDWVAANQKLKNELKYVREANSAIINSNVERMYKAQRERKRRGRW